MTATRQFQAPTTRVPETTATHHAPTPTGRNMIAQQARSAAALGVGPQNAPKPEGAEEGGALPKGWRWVTLRGIAEIAGGVTKGQKRRPKESIRKVPYLRVANVQRGYLDLTEVKEIDASETEIADSVFYPATSCSTKVVTATSWAEAGFGMANCPNAYIRITFFELGFAIPPTAPSLSPTTEIPPGRSIFTTRESTPQILHQST